MMKTKSHRISGAFVCMLLGVFAVFSMLLVVLGAFPRFARTVYHLAIDEGAMEGEDLLFDTGYIGEL